MSAVSAPEKTEVKSHSENHCSDLKIIAFACNWCSYAGADLAGVSRLQYDPSVRLIRVMCSGRIDPGLILTAFDNGMDGVLVTGCHPGDCHYISGNERAELTIETARELIHTLGIDKERLRLRWISASEGQRFAETINEFVSDMKKLVQSKNPKAVKKINDD